MLAATRLNASDTWGWSTRSPLIRQRVTAWEQPTRATTAQPWDTKKTNDTRVRGYLEHAHVASERPGN